MVADKELQLVLGSALLKWIEIILWSTSIFILRSYHAYHCRCVDVINIFFRVFLRVSSYATIPANNQVSLDGLNESEWIYLDGSAFPLTQIAAVWMTLKIALKRKANNVIYNETSSERTIYLELMCIEELKSTCVRATSSSRWKIVYFDGELLQLRYASVKLGDESAECRWIYWNNSAVTA